MAFEAKVNPKGDEVVIQFVGTLDEDAELPKPESFSAAKKIEIDMQKMTGINSVGTRTWINWIQGFAGKIPCDLRMVPHFILSQGAMVSGFLPTSIAIQSFSLNYHCDDLDESKNHVFDQTGGKYKIPMTVFVTKDGAEVSYQLDHHPGRVLKCLEGKYETYEAERGAFFKG